MICVLILNKNGSKYLKECITSFKNSSFKDKKIIVIDNGSDDDSLKVLKKISGIEIIENGKNEGYCKGFNIGVKYAFKKYNPKYIIVSNNDLIIEKNAIKNLYDGMESKPDVGFGGAKQLDYHTGEVQSYGGAWDRLRGTFYTNKKVVKNKEVEYVEGTFIMVRSDMLKKKGAWDERYFIYQEDAEIQYRYHKLGYKSMIFDSAVIRHRSHWNSKRKPFQFYYMIRNRLLLIRENSSIFLFVYSLSLYSAFYLYSLFFARDISKSVFTGIIDYFRGKFYSQNYNFFSYNPN